MLTKFETKSSRVKGLSFHPSRPWILVSLHNGIVQLWDYRMGTLLDRFFEHDGPVRGIHFHSTQPLFVSGGDDYKIKVWNYKERRCLFTLLGHLDYVRTTFFHHDLPWILSASDDQTVRIWNWQSRTSVAVLTGHNHYVMCAQFHPTKDLIASASLDQSVRIWDFKALRKKHTRPASKPTPQQGMDPRKPPISTDLFGPTEVVVKHLLDGHDRGVNWVTFHPTLPMVLTASDDRSVRLWRMSETSAWEVAVMRGHYNNVSCALFAPRSELIVTDSEDKSIRVWDMNKRTALQTFRREKDRFWFITEHPTQNLFAAGHDGGMIIFKLERERPAYTLQDGRLLYMKNRNGLHVWNFANGSDTSVYTIHCPASSNAVRGQAIPLSISYDPSSNSMVCQFDTEGGTYELYDVPRDLSGASGTEKGKRGLGTCAVFISHGRFAVLDKSNQIIIKNTQNEVTKKIVPPVHGVDGIFYGGPGMLLMKTDEKIYLFDIQSMKITGELALTGCKYTCWSKDMQYCAFMCKHIVAVTDRKLTQVASLHEMIRVKSGAWDNANNVFIYSTLNHIKYVVPGIGEGGTLRTIQAPLYITHVKGQKVYTIDRFAVITALDIDLSEYLFKLALAKKQYREVLRLMKHSRLTGQSIIGYLQRKGFPEVALHFVKDDRSRFNLAVECGNLEVALEAAKNVDEKEYWDILAVEALRQGNHQVVEMAYQRTKNFDRLSFLYLLTGNAEKLRKMLKIAEMREDVMGRFHNAMYLGDVKERLKVLLQVGNLPLAYALAKSHGLEEMKDIEAKLIAQGVDLSQTGFDSREPILLLPPTPILKSANWPLLSVSKGFFENMLDQDVPDEGLEEEDNDEVGEETGGWGGDELDDVTGDNDMDVAEEEEDGGGWGDDDLDVGDIQSDEEFEDDFVAPIVGTPVEAQWSEHSVFAADHAAAGDVQGMMNCLKSQVGITQYGALLNPMLNCRIASHAVLNTVAGVPPIGMALHRNWESEKHMLPSQSMSAEHLVERAKACKSMFQHKKIAEALIGFESILQCIPLVVPMNKKDDELVEGLIRDAREYIICCKIQAKLVKGKGEAWGVEDLKFAVAATQCDINREHRQFPLHITIVHCIKNECYLTAQRLHELLRECKRSENTEKLYRKAAHALKEKAKELGELTDRFELEFDPHNPGFVDAHTLTYVYQGTTDETRCPFCRSLTAQSTSLVSLEAYTVGIAGTCPTCSLGEMGRDGTGLPSSSTKMRRR